MRQKYIQFVRQAFYVLLVRPVLIILLGLNVYHLDRLKAGKNKLIAANHNSHLDALVLMSLFKIGDIPKVKFVAAKDYWCRTPLIEWFSINIIGVIPISRKKEEGSDPIAPIIQGLDDGFTVVMFPEGSRGEPEKRQPFKFGIAKILEQRPDTNVVPIFMHGLGKSLPRGEGIPVPFVCQVNIGEEISWNHDREKFISLLEGVFSDLHQEIAPKEWC